ncbi:MAG: hypothetical protein AAFR67_02000 [Chloroflexota bacterium]
MRSLLILLIICVFAISTSAQEATPEPEQPIEILLTSGLVVKFPAGIGIQPILGGGETIIMEDDFGRYVLIEDARSHETSEESFYEDNDNIVVLVTPDGNRMLRAELSIESIPDLFGDVTSVYIYLALLPEGHVLRFLIAQGDVAESQETRIMQIVDNTSTVTDEVNIVSFQGGLTTMVYPLEWEWVTWEMVGLAVTLRHEMYFTSVWMFTETELQQQIDRENPETVIAQDIIDDVFDRYTRLDIENVIIETQVRYGRDIYLISVQNRRYLVFNLGNNDSDDFWFYMQFARTDEEPFNEADEAQLWQLVDSILLNQRESYYEPVEIVIP